MNEDVPWDISESIRQRLAALPEAARELVSVAAVVGQEVSGKLLAQATGLPSRETLTALDDVCRARLLVEDAHGAFSFTHDVIWQVIVADLGTTRRQIFHRRIAQTLEQDNSEQWLEALVYHYVRSDETAKAIPYLERAANRAIAQRAHGTAILFYWQEAKLLHDLGRDLEAAHTYEQLGAFLQAVAKHDEAIEALAQAADTYRQAADIESLGRVMGEMVELVTVQLSVRHTSGDASDISDKT